MKTSLISKINKPLLVVVFVSMFAFVATKAYFTASAGSPDNIYTSGTIDLIINQDSVLSVTNWKPGEEHTLEFDVQNTGTLPVYLKGSLRGEWDDSLLDPNMLEVVSLEKLVNGTWVSITQDGLNIDEEFFVSADGTENTLTMLEAQDTTSIRMVTKLSQSVTDEYQNKVYTAALHVAGKQVTQGSTWPTTY